MADKYCAELSRVVAAQLVHNVGYNTAKSRPLEVLQDILLRFMQKFARNLHGQAEHTCRTEPKLKDVALSLKSLGIDTDELRNYMRNVDPLLFSGNVSVFPAKRPSELYFSMPGSAKKTKRPAHIYEYLPPMPTLESDESSSESSDLEPETNRRMLEQGGDAMFDQKNKSNAGVDTGYKVSNVGTQRAKLSEPGSGVALRPTLPKFHSTCETNVSMTEDGTILPASEGILPEVLVPSIIEQFNGIDAPPDNVQFTNFLATTESLSNMINTTHAEIVSAKKKLLKRKKKKHKKNKEKKQKAQQKALKESEGQLENRQNEASTNLLGPANSSVLDDSVERLQLKKWLKQPK